MANMNFGVNILPQTNNTYTLGNSSKKWNLFVNQINGADVAVPPLIITTSNASASDALTYETAATLSEGQLIFVILSQNMAGSANATLKLGSNTAINLYRDNTHQLNAAYVSGSVLGFIYTNNKLIMINPPIAV